MEFKRQNNLKNGCNMYDQNVFLGVFWKYIQINWIIFNHIIFIFKFIFLLIYCKNANCSRFKIVRTVALFVYDCAFNLSKCNQNNWKKNSFCTLLLFGKFDALKKKKKNIRSYKNELHPNGKCNLIYTIEFFKIKNKFHKKEH